MGRLPFSEQGTDGTFSPDFPTSVSIAGLALETRRTSRLSPTSEVRKVKKAFHLFPISSRFPGEELWFPEYPELDQEQEKEDHQD